MKKQWDEARAVDYVEEVWRACLNVPYDITTRRPMPKTKLPSGHVIAMLEAMVCMGVLSGYGHTAKRPYIFNFIRSISSAVIGE